MSGKRGERRTEGSGDLLPLAELTEALQSLEPSVDRLYSGAETVDESLSRITRDGLRASEIFEEMGRLTKDLLSSVQLVSGSTELAARSLDRCAERVSSGTDSVEDVLGSLGRVADNVSDVRGTYLGLGKRIEEVERNLRTISHIATLTEESARNAEIKAFHAGELGRGFGVVAKEMAELAISSTQTAEKAPVFVNSMREKTDEVSQVFSAADSSIARISAHASKIKEGLGGIRDFINRTLPAFKEIEISVEVQRGLQGELSDSTEELSRLAGGMFISVDRASLVAGGKRAEVDGLLSASYTLKEIFASLRESSGERVPLNSRNLSISLKRSLSILDKLRSQTVQLREILPKISLNLERDSLEKTAQRGEALAGEIASISANSLLVQELVKAELESLRETETEMERIDQEVGRVETLTDDSLKLMEKLEIDFWKSKALLQDVSQLSERAGLLSAYAAIEAARTGPHREDLEVSVVQTRDLSARSSGAAQSMALIEQEMESSLRENRLSLEHSLKTIEEAKRAIARSKTALSGIDSSINELDQLTGEVVRAVGDQKKAKETMGILFDRLTSTLWSVNEVVHELKTAVDEEEGLRDRIASILREGEKRTRSLAELVRERKCGKSIYRLVLPGDPLTLDPASVSDSTSNAVARNLFSGLLSFGRDTRVIPGIAESWRLSEDGRIWSFKIRKGVLFHNGDEMTSEDVRYTFERALRHRNASYFDLIEGAREFIAGKAATLKGIRILDKYRVEISLSCPSSPFLYNLATTAAGIVPRGFDEQNESFIGAGPFRLKEWRRGERLVLESFEDYHEGRPYVDEVHFIMTKPSEAFSLFRGGEVEHVDLRPAEVEKVEFDPRYRNSLASQPSLNTLYIGFNLSLSNPFSDKRVRQALNLALDKDDFLRRTAGGRGVVARGVFPPGLPSYNRNLTGYHYDPGRAKSLLAQAGYPDGLPGEFRLDVRDSEVWLKRGKLVKDYFGALGVQLTLNPVPWKELLRLAHSGESALFMMGWVSDNGDPDNFLYPLFYSRNRGEGGNSTFYENHRVDELILKAREEKNPHQRLRLYQKAETLIVEDCPWVFLFHPVNHFVHQPGVRGFRIHPLSFIPLDEVWFDQ